MKRVYLDYNATTPLALASRDAMIEAMDVIGNPSSVHAEGRAAKAIVEKSRRQVAEALGAEPSEVVFTSGATEACFLALSGNEIQGAEIEHDAVRAHCVNNLSVEHTGRVRLTEPSRCTLQAANSETGLLQSLPQDLFFSDMTQAFGKSPLAFGWSGIKMAAVSAHKIGGPKGVGALLVKKVLILKRVMVAVVKKWGGAREPRILSALRVLGPLRRRHKEALRMGIGSV